MTSTRTTRLLAICCWALLTLQLPWHTGMAGGRVLAVAAGADGSAAFCGGPLSSSAVLQLRAEGLLPAPPEVSPASQRADASDLCALFGALTAASAGVVVTPVAAPVADAVPPLPSYPCPALSVYTRPPVRGPPLLA